MKYHRVYSVFERSKKNSGKKKKTDTVKFSGQKFSL